MPIGGKVAQGRRCAVGPGDVDLVYAFTGSEAKMGAQIAVGKVTPCSGYRAPLAFAIPRL